MKIPGTLVVSYVVQGSMGSITASVVKELMNTVLNTILGNV